MTDKVDTPLPLRTVAEPAWDQLPVFREIQQLGIVRRREAHALAVSRPDRHEEVFLRTHNRLVHADSALITLRPTTTEPTVTAELYESVDVDWYKRGGRNLYH
ncbi:hypothetical protein ACQP00_21185 [Dactylosporangium sp. CS-047395]|uniref:hypothetical protein n=1 Tax=Dactylosporangium sp. CS-047395 TaxID=3239936 RepID=UPI003D89E22F